MLLACFAWLVWLLYACGVRRFKGLWRVCLPFILLPFSFCLSFYLFASAFCPSPCLLCYGCLLLVLLSCLFLCPCGFCRCFLFPCGIYAKRKGAKGCPCVLACLVVGCFIWLLLCIPRTRQVSARLYRNKVLEKDNLIECSKLFCARLCSYLCSSKFVFLLFSYLGLLVGSCFLSPFGGVLFVILLH